MPKKLRLAGKIKEQRKKKKEKESGVNSVGSPEEVRRGPGGGRWRESFKEEAGRLKRGQEREGDQVREGVE